MHCPYCTSDISDAALVCPVCTRDLYLFKPLLQRIEELEKQVLANNAGTTQTLETSLAASALAPAEQHNFLKSAFIGCAVLVVLLLIAHALIIVVYDLKPLFLRIASLLIPLPFGFALYLRHPGRGSALAIIAAMAACVAVFGMSAVTGHIDNTPIFPRDLRELREFIEYAASIAFSFLTGVLLGKLLHNRMYGAPAPNRMVRFVAGLFATDAHGQLWLERVITRITRFVTATAPAVSGAISVYTGIKTVIG